MGLGNSFPCPECLGHRAKHMPMTQLRKRLTARGEGGLLMGMPADLLGEDAWLCADCGAFGLAWLPDPVVRGLAA